MSLPNYSCYRRLWGERTGLSFWAGARGLGVLLGSPLLWAWRVGLRAYFSNPINIYGKIGTDTMYLNMFYSKIPDPWGFFALIRDYPFVNSDTLGRRIYCLKEN